MEPTSANDGPNPVTVHAVDTGGAFDNQSYIVNVTDLNTLEGQKYALLATPTPPPPPAPPGPAGPTLPILLAPITTLPSPNAVVYYAPNNSLIASINYYGGTPYNFEQVLSSGKTIPFGNVSGFTDEVQIGDRPARRRTRASRSATSTPATARLDRSSRSRTTATRSSIPGSPCPARPATCAAISGSTRHGVWGGNMIVSTTAGDVWEVTPSGTATELAAAVGDADTGKG